MLKAGIVRPSTSPWSSPVVIVPKKEGTLRFCVDYRKLNNVTVKNSYPLPHVDDIFASLGKAKFLSSFDLRAGYWQIEVEERDKPKTAFVCHRGLYEFNKMPFGLCNAPSIFQNLMNHVLGEAQSKYATAYIDDVLIYSETFEYHMKHMRDVLNRFEEAGLKLKLKKCDFLKEKLKYLGHVISENGIEPNDDNVRAIRDLSVPTTVREVRSFLGAAGYYRKFIENYAKLAKPLTALTRKNQRFYWDEETQQAFDTLKVRLTTAPILAYADPTKPYKLYTDASQYAVGAVLTQEFEEGDDRVIQYISHQLNEGQTKWPCIEREAYAIVYGITKLRHYLLGARFTVFTDHKPLKSLFTSQMKNTKIPRWAILLNEYGCDIQYRSGKNNVRADMLSRIRTNDELTREPITIEPITNGIHSQVEVIDSDQLTQIEPEENDSDDIVENDDGEETTRIDLLNISRQRLKSLQYEEEWISRIIQSIKKGEPDKEAESYVLDDGLLYHLALPVHNDDEPNLQLVLPSKLTSTVLTAYHDDLGHLGINKTYHTIRGRYYFRNMYTETVKHLQKCVVCNSRNLRKTTAEMQDMPMPNHPFEIIGIDTCGPYSETEEGNKYIITIVDHFSGWPEAYPSPNKTAESVARILFEKFIPRHSCPRLIISDQGTEFCNAVISSLSAEMNIQRIKTSPYHPQSNGKTERFHRVMNDILAKTDRNEWDVALPCALFAYRTTVNETTKFTPFLVVYGRDPILPMDTLLGPKVKYLGDDYVPTMIQRMHRVFVNVKRNTNEARERNKARLKAKAKAPELEIGDPVYYLNKRANPDGSTKFMSQWQPYYRVIERLSPVNYRIKNQVTGKIKKVHVENLRIAHPEATWDLERLEPTHVLRKSHGHGYDDEPRLRTQPVRMQRLAEPDALVTDEGGYLEDTLSDPGGRSQPKRLDDSNDVDQDVVPPIILTPGLSQQQSQEMRQAAEPVTHGYFLRKRAQEREQVEETKRPRIEVQNQLEATTDQVSQTGQLPQMEIAQLKTEETELLLGGKEKVARPPSRRGDTFRRMCKWVKGQFKR